ncbi:MAG: adenylyltransferase/cytidyltransferase family protein, partial [Clostridia bacterium]|nr:adenylyltransferase/cytidyltransferase family protein [Clostridia bacterium]
MRIGILGGTFAPPHKAHICIAKTCLDYLELDKVLFMPNGQPPHKQGEKVVSAEHRLNM